MEKNNDCVVCFNNKCKCTPALIKHPVYFQFKSQVYEPLSHGTVINIIEIGIPRFASLRKPRPSNAVSIDKPSPFRT